MWFRKRKLNRLQVELARVTAQIDEERMVSAIHKVYYPMVMSRLIGDRAVLSAKIAQITERDQ